MLKDGIMENGNSEDIIKEINRSYDSIGKILEQPKLNTRDAMEEFLRAQRLTFAFFARIVMEDHKKMQKIYPAYQIILWIAGIFGVSILGLLWALFTGQVELIWK